MKLSQLLGPWINQEYNDCSITDLKNDSRQVKSGDLFIAYPGAATDGRLFIDSAVKLGASAIVYEPQNFPSSCNLPSTIPCIPIANLADKLSDLAKRFFRDPGEDLQLTGVTGTNGKTTIAYQLAQAHELLGRKSAYIGTIGQGSVNNLKNIDNTTPDALCLQRFLYEYRQDGIQQVCMEVSSHALSQHRVDSLCFNQAIFTNLTLDHLDYHKTMEAYGAAKARLFAREELQWAILNHDDEAHQLMAKHLKNHVRKMTYGLHEGCDVKALSWAMDITGTTIDVQSPWGEHSLSIHALGQFNIYNSLAVFSSLLASGYSPETVVKTMTHLKAAPGRMEIVSKAPYVLVDYAHTPDALENVLVTLNQLKKGNLWVVFGCGGDRDKTKRPIMGKAASRFADNVIITSDNPRSEDPQVIIDEIAVGVSKDSSLFKLSNREEAIAFALNKANENDIILIAGKGHEAYQQIGKVKHPFSDQEVVRKLRGVD
ncbi:UDP-N-acetylmuramoyl-L-alanyl-D-glutamate--2,6-diaminopimelate ligase [Legionella waltersii]|uniref:UDP-N-acetylmuramoyl-L-alanyl-D-glutamate--2,6-diaminopimelate ligase n=1 Tax=Legionella waltersii TaxID=66969 RepID=A0A0W1ANM2_9GAMM|nr:UDP-N-acetylmuramoyl-L-alanyl-D-glutamate--2,6-diaminopimelate ligase [Legionella waltersii]KTD82906.1 UDP-N-acetylmuramyl-tripeptide synthetase MurE [Legionella waltersii]SNV02210.1 UDP-N-acetylmuramyl-tripeptide synthetase MurE [Legionella waltersii]